MIFYNFLRGRKFADVKKAFGNIINEIKELKRKTLFTDESITFYGDYAAEFISKSLRDYLFKKKCYLFNIGATGKFARKATLGKLLYFWVNDLIIYDM